MANFPSRIFTVTAAKLLPGHGPNASEGVGHAAILAELRSEIAGMQASPTFKNTGIPKSGTAGTHVGIAIPGALCYDVTGRALYVNTNTAASPYWEMVSTPGEGNTIGARSYFGGGANSMVPIAGTTASVNMDGGVRIFGDGHSETDSGVIPGESGGEGGRPHGVFTTTNEDLHTINAGGPTVSYQPDQHGTAVVDAEFATVSALTDRSHFMGFVGGAIDAMVTPATISTTVITNVLNDLVGFVMDSNAGDADGVFVTDNSSNGNATNATSATGRDLSAPLVAGAFRRLRVEIDEDGGFRCFDAKVLVYTGSAAAMDVDEELSPVLQLMAGGAAIKTMHVRSYEHYWNRSTS